MGCLECKQAAQLHEDLKKLSQDLRDAIKLFEHGKFYQAIEDLEMVAIRFDNLHRKQMERGD